MKGLLGKKVLAVLKKFTTSLRKDIITHNREKKKKKGGRERINVKAIISASLTPNCLRGLSRTEISSQLKSRNVMERLSYFST